MQRSKVEFAVGKWVTASFLCLLIVTGGTGATSQIVAASGRIVIDASTPVEAPAPADYSFAAEEARNPAGHVLGLNARYLTLDGKPWLPVMGEMHYSRVPEADWEEQILKMKSAGVQIVAAYIIWIHHEEIEDEWDWSGQKDLRRFVQLCAKHGMYVVPRIGPWSHAEVRNGGFPDWLMTKATHQRQNDPAYLGYVEGFYRQIGEQLRGQMWSEGGPVVAVQLENEYRGHGALGGTDHILRLKEMARAAGLRVPFYTVTAWDGASIPTGAVLPVGGGYPDAPWDASIESLPASGVYAFHIRDQAATDMGAQNANAPMVSEAHIPRATPYITVEMGGGMQITYHRRPVVSADDVVAMVPTMLGSGVNLYGSYMFQGGENPDGKRTTLQESLATGAPNDLPVKSYDFEAFLGEFGDERESLRKEKSWNYFMNDFGAELAPMVPRKPDVQPRGPADLSVARVSARTSGASGFVFVNNHVRGYGMPARPGFQVEVKLPGGSSLRIPAEPVDLPPDSYFVWPFGMDLGGVHLRYATAQPLARLGTDAAPVYAFFAQPGIRPQFVLDDTPGMKIEGAPAARRDGAVWISDVAPGTGAELRFTLPGGRAIKVLVLRQQDAEQAWKVATGKATALVVTPQEAFVDEADLTLDNLGGRTFEARAVPAGMARLVAAEPEASLKQSGPETKVEVAGSGPGTVSLRPKLVRPASEPAPLPTGFEPSNKPRSVAAAPADADWSRAGLWQIPIPGPSGAENTQRFLRIRYVGDVARLSAQGKLLTDNFADGRPWLVGLSRFARPGADSPLELSIYPLRQKAPVFFEPGLEPKFAGSYAATLTSVDLITDYRTRLRVELLPAKAK